MPTEPPEKTAFDLIFPLEATGVVFTDPYRDNITRNSCSTISVDIPADTEVSYSFQAGDKLLPDPHNADNAGPHTSILCGSSVDRQLWPARPHTHSATLPGTRLRLDKELFARRCTARLDKRESEYTVVFLDGDDWIHLHDLTTALDRAVAHNLIPEVTRVFVPAALERTAEYTSAIFANALAQQLPGALDTQSIIVVGQSFSGLAAVRAGLISARDAQNASHPHHSPTIHGVIAQSPALWWGPHASANQNLDGPLGGIIAEELQTYVSSNQLLPTAAPHHECARLLPQFLLTTGTEEAAMHKHVDHVAHLLHQAGISAHYRTTAGGHDPAAWRHEIVPALAQLIDNPS